MWLDPDPTLRQEYGGTNNPWVAPGGHQGPSKKHPGGLRGSQGVREALKGVRRHEEARKAVPRKTRMPQEAHKEAGEAQGPQDA